MTKTNNHIARRILAAAPQLLEMCEQARYCLDKIKDAEPHNSPRLRSGSLLNRTIDGLLAAIAAANVEQ